MTELIEPEDYTLEVEGVVWEVYAGTHRIHYRCKHQTVVVAWSDWNVARPMHQDQDGIPEHPRCQDPLDNCGHLEILAGCHDRHEHHPDRQPKKRRLGNQ